jgi:hypothetical protein
MSETWHTRVRVYVDQLEQISKAIESILEQTKVETTEVDTDQVEQSTVRLEHALAELEERIAQRESLLKARDAPVAGLTLTEKLKSTLHIDDAHLARRCEDVAAMIASTNQRAVALFVCQYHLSEFSTEVVRLLSGNSIQSTYGPSSSIHAGTSGSLFNESA